MAKTQETKSISQPSSYRSQGTFFSVAALVCGVFVGVGSILVAFYSILKGKNTSLEGLNGLSLKIRDQHTQPYILLSQKVLIEDELRPAAIIIGSNGCIIKIADTLKDTERLDLEIVDVGMLVVMPGLVDVHVHVNSPGRTEWEGYDSATKAAAAGGTTTILDMPLNSIPSTTDLNSLKKKHEAVQNENIFVDVGLIGGVVGGGVDERIRELVHDGGVFALKSFMVDSQSNDFPHVTVPELQKAMEIIASIDRLVPYIIHAELPPLDYDPKTPYKGSSSSYMDYLNSRPPEWEVNAVEVAMNAAEKTGCPIHIAHVSAADVFQLLSKSNATVTTETCPQYLLWSSDDISDSHPEYKCAPPIRDKENRRKLVRELKNGNIDIIASDHSPSDPRLKYLLEGNVRKAWGGISGLQYRLSGVWTALEDLDVKDKISIATLSNMLSANPAKIFELSSRKGSIKEGVDADLVVWNPDESFEPTTENCYHRHQVNPFIGMELKGVVHHSIVRGHFAFNLTSGFKDPPGKLLFRLKNGSVHTVEGS